MFLRVLLPVRIGDARRTAALAASVGARLGLPVEEVDGSVIEVVDVAMASSGLVCVADAHHVHLSGPFDPTRQLVTLAGVPVLVAGPHVAVESGMPFGQLVVCMAGDDFTARLGRAAVDWVRAAGARAWLLEVTRTPSSPSHSDWVDAAPVCRLAADLARAGIDAPWDVVHDDRFARRVLRVAAELPPAVLAVVRDDPDRHLPGGADRTARLVRHASVPLLVVPPGRRYRRPRWTLRRWAHAA